MTQRILHRHISHRHPSHWNHLLRSIIQIHADLTGQTGLLARAPPLRSNHTRQAKAPVEAPALLSSLPPASAVRLRIHSSGRKRNHSSWTPEADAQLVSLRSQGQTWTQIGQSFGKSRQACNRRFDSVLDPTTGSSFWTHQSDRNDELRGLVARGLGWKQIAAKLGTKASACEKQWRILERERVEATEATKKTLEVEEEERTWRHLSEGRQFRKADVELLRRAVVELGATDQWKTIAKDVFGSKFSPAQLRYQYTKLEHRRRAWSDQQDEDLFRVVKDRYKINQGPEPSSASPSNFDVLTECQWDAVAGSIQGEHTAAECRERWIKMQLGVLGRRKSSLMDMHNSSDDGKKRAGSRHDDFSGSKAKGCSRVCWSTEQNQRFESIIRRMKDSSPDRLIKWDEVSAQMDGEFTKTQCKSRWNRMQRQVGCSSTGRWGDDEVENLIRGVSDLGDQWTAICRRWVPGRTPTFIQGKWKGIVSKLNQEMVIRRWSWKQACIETFGGEVGERLSKLPSGWPDMCVMPGKKM